VGCTTRIQFPAGAVMVIFLLAAASKPALGPTQPPVRWVPGALAPAVKRQGREADNSRPPSAEVKNAWSCTSTLPYVYMAYVLS
jgi:hypothetical protein